MSYKYKFTIFTPCFNSEKFIHRVIESVESQTFRDFEWLVINDASTDNTGKILEEYSYRAKFPVKIIQNTINRMLYYNFNIAFKQAQGELMIFAGHDDRFNSETLQTFNDIWNTYGDDSIAGIWCLCQDQYGKQIGNRFPVDFLISNYFEMYEKYIYKQERFGCTRTEVLKAHPFNIKGGRVGEGLLWAEIGLEYRTIYINKVLRTYYSEPDNVMALTKSSRSKLAKQVYASYSDWINMYLDRYPFSIQFKYRYHFAMAFYGMILKINIFKLLNDVDSFKSKMVIIILVPFALGLKIFLSLRGKL